MHYIQDKFLDIAILTILFYGTHGMSFFKASSPTWIAPQKTCGSSVSLQLGPKFARATLQRMDKYSVIYTAIYTYTLKKNLALYLYFYLYILILIHAYT